MTRGKIFLFAFIVGMMIPAIFLFYMSGGEPFTYLSVVFVSLLYAAIGGALKLLWSKAKNQPAHEGIGVVVALSSLPLVLIFWLASFSDYTPYEQVPRKIAILNPLLSAFIGFWIVGLVAKKQKAAK